jgi:hypothetical protein
MMSMTPPHRPCGAKMKIVSVITDPRVLDRILQHLKSEACRARDSFESRAPPKAGGISILILDQGSARQLRQNGSARLGRVRCAPVAIRQWSAVCFIFMLDIHGAFIACIHQDGKDLRPFHLSVTRNTIRPPARPGGRINTATLEDIPEDLAIRPYALLFKPFTSRVFGGRLPDSQARYEMRTRTGEVYA